MAEAAQRGAREGRPVALFAVDLDDFKSCNDLYGHGVGDGVLVAVGDRLRTLAVPTDTVARLGGDEFALVVEGADEARVRALAARVVEVVGATIDVAHGSTEVEVIAGGSVGVALLARGG